MSFLTAGSMGTMPYIAACVGVLLAGGWSDRMVKHGKTLTVAEKDSNYHWLIGSLFNYFCELYRCSWTRDCDYVGSLLFPRNGGNWLGDGV